MKDFRIKEKSKTLNQKGKMKEVLLGGGCFWCLEAIFQRVPGVIEVLSGYAGGTLENPSYRQVCGGKTGFNIF